MRVRERGRVALLLLSKTKQKQYPGDPKISTACGPPKAGLVYPRYCLRLHRMCRSDTYVGAQPCYTDASYWLFERYLVNNIEQTRFIEMLFCVACCTEQPMSRMTNILTRPLDGGDYSYVPFGLQFAKH